MRKERKAEKNLGELRGMVGLEPRADVGKSLQEPWKLSECLVSLCIAGFSGKPPHEIISCGGDHIIFDMPCTWI